MPARSGALPLTERLSGTVKARNQVAIRPEIEAAVTAVLVQSGQTVTAGQPLVRLDDRQLQDQVRQATANLRLAEASAAEAKARVAGLEAEVFRSRKLVDDGLISDLELETQEAQLTAVRAAADQAAAGVEQAAATVEERRSALDKTVVRSPVGGRVGRRGAEVGMLVDPSTLLFEVGDLGELRVEVPLTGEMLNHVREGQRVRIVTTNRQGRQEAVEAELSRISPFLDPASFSTVGEIDVDQPATAESGTLLNPGAFVTVEIFYGESETATLVPASALWDDPRTGIQGIYVLRGAEDLEAPEATETSTAADSSETQEALPPPSEKLYGVELRPVELIAEGRGVLGVEGLREGEWVVTVGQQLLAGTERPEGAAQAGQQEEATEIRTRVRPVTWQRVLDLQGLQRENLLQAFLEKQQRLARERGAQPPSNEEFLGRPVGEDAAKGES